MGSIAKTKPVRWDRRSAIGARDWGWIGGADGLELTAINRYHRQLRLKCRMKCGTQIADQRSPRAVCRQQMVNGVHIWEWYGEDGGRMGLEIADLTSRVPPLSHPEIGSLPFHPESTRLSWLSSSPSAAAGLTWAVQCAPILDVEPGPLRSSHRSLNVWQLPF